MVQPPQSDDGSWPQLIADAGRLVAQLHARAATIVTAESCTGGLVCAALTEIPGASNVVDRGYVTYSNEAKVALLGVEPRLIERCGAVSSEVARAMAEGALRHAGADLAISVTGIAGPGGARPGKPVGLVHFAVARSHAETVDHQCRFGDIGRRDIRMAAARFAIGMATQLLTVSAGKKD